MTPRPPDHSDDYRGARVLVLGASGFIGHWATRALVERGAVVHVTVRDPDARPLFADRAPNDAVAGIHTLDVTDVEAVGELLGAVQPAVTFNLCGYGVDPSERDETLASAVNEGAVRTIAEALAGLGDSDWDGQRMVHVGSALEYGEAAGDLDERTVPIATTLYGRTKLAGTNALTEVASRRGLRGLTARLFTVYGAGEHSRRLLPSLIAARTDSKPLALTSGEQRRDFTYVEDVVEGLLRLGMSRAEPGAVVNLATGRLTTVREFAERAAAVLGLAPGRLHFGALPTRTEEMHHEPPTMSLLRSLTGWVPDRSIEEGVRATVSALERYGL